MTQLSLLAKGNNIFCNCDALLNNHYFLINLKMAKKSQGKVMFLHISLQLDNQSSNSTERKAVIKVQLLIVVLEYGLLA